jgi:hypothetical protein
LGLPHLRRTHITERRNTGSLLNLVLQIIFDSTLWGLAGLGILSHARATFHLA